MVQELSQGRQADVIKGPKLISSRCGRLWARGNNISVISCQKDLVAKKNHFQHIFCTKQVNKNCFGSPYILADNTGYDIFCVLLENDNQKIFGIF